MLQSGLMKEPLALPRGCSLLELGGAGCTAIRARGLFFFTMSSAKRLNCSLGSLSRSSLNSILVGRARAAASFMWSSPPSRCAIRARLAAARTLAPPLDHGVAAGGPGQKHGLLYDRPRLKSGDLADDPLFFLKALIIKLQQL